MRKTLKYLSFCISRPGTRKYPRPSSINGSLISLVQQVFVVNPRQLLTHHWPVHDPIPWTHLSHIRKGCHRLLWQTSILVMIYKSLRIWSAPAPIYPRTSPWRIECRSSFGYHWLYKSASYSSSSSHSGRRFHSPWPVARHSTQSSPSGGSPCRHRHSAALSDPVGSSPPRTV